ncbi:hypothetical protein FOG51_02821 [Hanseniaspora uvarum]|jgi:hypothetical protein|nr:hypothetical protein FOG51_02821 [Hanseniaspora uvarum]KAF0278940.1 hypothetical protein FOG50_00208 [Hanseniaspora uvarum]KKA02131.1 hypothetical protein D499_0N00630 [Hanseniaspora uvarum DSM 2768]GMM43058.1 hypothetical protein DAHU10_039680 [Hanseniaspora uvarum]
MLTSFFILNNDGTTIFNKLFSDSLKKNATFRTIFTTDRIIEINKKIMKDIDKMEKDITNHIDTEVSLANSHFMVPPILTIGTTTMIYIYRDGLFYVAVINKNEEAIFIWDNLIKLYEILNDLKILKSLRLKESMLKLIHIINFVIDDQGVFQTQNINLETINHYLIQSY